MVSSIGSTSSYWARPDTGQLASKLFAKLDTKNQGYIEKSDLEAALSNVAQSSTASSTSTSAADTVFKQLDSDGNGKVTEQELADSLKKLTDQIDAQRQYMAVAASANGAQAGTQGMPPPPPSDGASDAGFTKDELTAQLSQIGSSDTQRSSLMSSIVANFDTADTNGDGKVTGAEAMAYAQSQQGTPSAQASNGTTSASDASTSSTASASGATDDAVLRRILQLLQAYGAFSQDASQSSSTSSLSTTA